MEDETMGRKEMPNCRCLELQEKVLKAEESYIDLESKMQSRNKEFESLELRFKELESEKLVMEEELRNLKESELDEQMVNGALEVEKQMAENDAAEWKRKFEKLADALNMEGLAYVGSPYIITTPVKDSISGRNRDNVSSRRRVNKMLVFEGDGSKSTDVDDLSDIETEERNEKESDGKDTLEERSIGENYEDEDVEANTSTPLTGRKRKLVVTSDSENDDDEDNISISILKNLKPPNQEVSDLVDTPSIRENVSGGLRKQRRVSSRLRKQREISTSSERNSTERLVGIPTTGNAEDDETEEDSERESESESLEGFIVDDETASEKSDETEGDVREEESDGETGYADIMSRLRRDKNPWKRKWEYQTDMLAAFGKDPELCMRAVCALYRLQTEDEKAARSSYVANGRGFSKFDAKRGCRIGHFLTDGDPAGDLKKSVEELRSFEPGAVDTCEHLAGRYSKQLFQIYNNREDPFFAAPPSP